MSTVLSSTGSGVRTTSRASCSIAVRNLPVTFSPSSPTYPDPEQSSQIATETPSTSCPSSRNVSSKAREVVTSPFAVFRVSSGPSWEPSPRLCRVARSRVVKVAPRIEEKVDVLGALGPD